MRKMNFIAVLVLLASFYYSVNAYDKSRCWTSGNNKPAQWWSQGDVITRGRYYYECRDGQLEPLGCLSNLDQQVPIGNTFQQDEYEFICRLGSDGYLEFEYNACVGQDGKSYQKGETWTDGKNLYYYRCQDNGRVVKAIIEGCLSHDKQRRVALGETDDYNGYTYKCQQKTNGVVQMCSVGCVHEGVRYSVGQQFRDGDFLFYCKIKGGKCSKQCIGCVIANPSKNLFDGQRFHANGTTYQCEIRAETHRVRAVGCSVRAENGQQINKVVGCRWYETNYDWKIEKTCEADTAENSAKVITVGCIYRYKGFDRIFLTPGKYTIWNLPKSKETIGLACRQTATSAEMTIFDVSKIAENTAGLQYDMPRGK